MSPRHLHPAPEQPSAARTFGGLLHDPETTRTRPRRRPGISLSASTERVRPTGRVLLLGAFLAVLAFVSGAFDPSEPGSETGRPAQFTPAAAVNQGITLLYRGIEPYLDAADAARSGDTTSAYDTASLEALYPSFAEVIEAWAMTAAEWDLPADRVGSVPSTDQVADFTDALRGFDAAQGSLLDALDLCATEQTPPGRCDTSAFDLAYARLQETNAALLGQGTADPGTGAGAL